MLNPALASFQTWIDAILRQYGIRAVITSTERTCADQARVNPTQLRSFHLTGEAIDISLEPDISALEGLSGVMLPGAITGVELLNQYKPELQEWVGSWAEHFGFRWGGRFKRNDPVHVDTGNFHRLGECLSVAGGRVDRRSPVLLSAARGSGIATGRRE